MSRSAITVHEMDVETGIVCLDDGGGIFGGADRKGQAYKFVSVRPNKKFLLRPIISTLAHIFFNGS